MPQIILGFSHHPNKWISRLAKWGMRGNYSHIMMLEPEGRRYIEASGTSNPPGVQIRDLSEFFASRPEWEFRTVEHPDPKAVWEAACKRVGRPYDWMFFIAWAFRIPWLQDARKDVCNETIFESFVEGGYSPFPDGIEVTYLTPQHWYLISEPLE